MSSPALRAPARRVLVTGSSGHLGSLLVAHVLKRQPEALVWGVDVQPPGAPVDDRFTFVRGDVCDGLEELVRRHDIEIIAHMAYPLAHVRTAGAWRRMAETATTNVLRAAEARSIAKLVMVSSTTVYGAHRQSTLADEHRRPQPNRNYPYAEGKVTMEVLTQAWLGGQPHCSVAILRPCIVIGPHVDNYMVRSLFQHTPLVAGSDPRLQFLHEDDFTAAAAAVMFGDATGVFNVTPADLGIARRQIHTLFGMSLEERSYDAVRIELQARWDAAEPDAAHPAILDLIVHEWSASPARLMQISDWRPTHSSTEALLAFSKALRTRRRRTEHS
jgi:UDP-glucose 4-epimerase